MGVRDSNLCSVISSLLVRNVLDDDKYDVGFDLPGAVLLLAPDDDDDAAGPVRRRRRWRWAVWRRPRA